MTCTAAMKIMYIVDYDQDDKPNLYVWDVKNSEVLMATPLKKSIPPDVMDVYIQLKLINDELHLLACYIRKYYGISKERASGDGFIDVISVTDGTVLRTIQEYLYKQPFNNCLLYTTKNYIGIRFGWKVPLVNIWTGERINLTQPHRLTNDETKFLRARSKKATVKSYHGEKKVLGYTRIKTATISNFQDSANLGEFLKSDSFSGLTISTDNSLALLADALGNINVYDIGSMLSDGKLIKVKIALSLPSNEKITVFDLKRNEEEKQCVKQTLIISPNDQYLIVCYQGISTWEAFSWNICSGHFIKRLARNRPTEDRYPSFSHDSRYVVDALTSCVNIIFLDSGITARTYQFGTQRIRSICVSQSSMEIVVLVGKDVVILELSEGKKLSSKKSSQSINEKEIGDTVLLTEEVITNDYVFPRILLKKDDLGKLNAFEISTLIKNDQFESSSSTENIHSRVLSWITPNGKHFIQLLAHVQIIDTQLEEIVYTPKWGDVVQRIDSSVDPPQTKSLNILNLDTIEAGLRMTELFEGDRIVKEDDNKIRFRVTQTGRHRVVTVPSVISIGRNNLQDNHRAESQKRCITIYQEEVVTFSNSFLVTIKTKHSKKFINIYDLEQAKFVTSHECRGQVETDDKLSGSVVRITTDESKLLIVDNQLNLRIFSGFNFTNMIASIAIPYDVSSSKNLKVKNLYLPPMNTNVCIVHLSTDARNDFSSTSAEYIHVNLTSKSCSLPLKINTVLDDISMDGQFGITDELVMYYLPTATIWTRIPYKKLGKNMQVQARISEDNGRVVFLDKQDDTIHVVELLANSASRSVRYVASCFTHAPNVPAINGFTLRHHGRVVVVRGGSSLLVFALNNCCGSKRPAVRSKDLHDDWSDTDRALLLVA